MGVVISFVLVYLQTTASAKHAVVNSCLILAQFFFWVSTTISRSPCFIPRVALHLCNMLRVELPPSLSRTLCKILRADIPTLNRSWSSRTHQCKDPKFSECKSEKEHCWSPYTINKCNTFVKECSLSKYDTSSSIHFSAAVTEPSRKSNYWRRSAASETGLILWWSNYRCYQYKWQQ